MPNLSTGNPLARIIDEQGFLVLDGGLATTLEERGHDLNDKLWSARVLLEEPDAIRRLHRDFLDAGADTLITASYQASLEGFGRRGLSAEEGAALIRASVDLACAARQEFLDDGGDRSDRPRPLVAASVGPYGAFLADGSEYTGRYDLDDTALRTFHRERWRILADSPADLLACETIPSLRETAILLSLLAATPGRWAWLSFSCRDGAHLNDGTRLVDAVRLCGAEARVAAVGINCTAPEHVASLIAEARRVTSKPIIAYPNLGEDYDAVSKTWCAGPHAAAWEQAAVTWWRAGARGVGGCCRVGPELIARVRREVAREQARA